MHSDACGAPVLLLVPTSIERETLEELGGLEAGLAVEALCGFGPIAAAARTAELLALLRPARVVLLGIAGSYDTQRLAIGSARVFETVAIDGIGAGEGEQAIGLARLGFAQWPGSPRDHSQPIVDRITLEQPAGDPLGLPAPQARSLLLTACSASDSLEHARLRRRRFPDALAEDMEGFAVALACSLALVPLSIVRGISNRAGERDRGHWQIREALSSARELALEILRSPAKIDRSRIGT